MTTDLSLVPLPDLLEELKKRCDTGVIIMRRVHIPEHHTYALTAHEWGNSFEVLGLLHVQARVVEARMAPAFKADPDP